MTEKEFAAWMGELARADMARTGVLASVTTAQAILESGYGTTDLAKNANNFFGMKCSLSGNTWPSVWDGTSKYTKKTAEDDGRGNLYYVTADFRKYPAPEQSVEDHSRYLLGAKNGSALRYAGLKGEKDPKKAITIIKAGGYATDTRYVDKILDIIRRFDLTQYDSAETPAQKGGEDMDININKQYITTNNSNSTNDPRYIVIHNTDNFNRGADALAHASGLYNGYMQGMSWHYVTDDKSIYQCLPHNRGAWHVGVNYGHNNLFGTVNNRNSIGIEMCVNKGYDYEKAFMNTVKLTRYLMQTLGIPADRVLQHYDVCTKDCPSQIRARRDWPRFKQLIGDTSIDVTPRNYLQRGDSGVDVSAMQKLLNDAGYNCGAVDGDFGPQTEKALLQFQADHSLTITGQYSAKDKATLEAAVNKPAEQGHKLYRVQTGAYKYKTNAKAELPKVQAVYPEAFITPKQGGFYRIQLGAYSIYSNAVRKAEEVKAKGLPAIVKEYDV